MRFWRTPSGYANLQGMFSLLVCDGKVQREPLRSVSVAPGPLLHVLRVGLAVGLELSCFRRCRRVAKVSQPWESGCRPPAVLGSVKLRRCGCAIESGLRTYGRVTETVKTGSSARSRKKTRLSLARQSDGCKEKQEGERGGRGEGKLRAAARTSCRNALRRGTPHTSLPLARLLKRATSSTSPLRALFASSNA